MGGIPFLKLILLSWKQTGQAFSLHVVVWEETGTPRVNPHRHEGNIQTLHRNDSQPSHSLWDEN